MTQFISRKKVEEDVRGLIITMSEVIRLCTELEKRLDVLEKRIDSFQEKVD